MTYNERLVKNHSDIIEMTKYRSPNYQVISFDKLLDRLFPNLNAFISSEMVSEARKVLENKYINKDVNCIIREQGVLKKFVITELKYYQTEVGINGPQHTKINTPVYVIRYNGNTILLNGYHRALVHLMDNLKISAYFLDVE